jgi:hypothetical protein
MSLELFVISVILRSGLLLLGFCNLIWHGFTLPAALA